MAYTPTTASVFQFDGNKCIGYTGENVETLVFPASYSLQNGVPVDGTDIEVTEIGNGTQSSFNGTFGRVVIPNNIRKINYRGLSGSSLGSFKTDELIFESSAVDELDNDWLYTSYSISSITFSNTVQGVVNVIASVIPSKVHIGASMTGLNMRSDAITEFTIANSSAKLCNDGVTVQFQDYIWIATGMLENGRYETPSNLDFFTTEMFNQTGLNALTIHVDQNKINLPPLNLKASVGSLTFIAESGVTAIGIHSINQTNGALRSITFQSAVDFIATEPTVIFNMNYLESLTFTSSYISNVFALEENKNTVLDASHTSENFSFFVPGSFIDQYKESLPSLVHLIKAIPGTEKRGVNIKFPYQDQVFENISVLRFEDKSGNETLLFQEHTEVMNAQSLIQAIYQDTLVEFRGDLQTPDLSKLHDGVFSYREALERVTLPATLAEVGDEAFMNSPNLKMVKFMGPVPRFGENVFAGTHPDLEIYVQATYESGYDNILSGLYGSDILNRIKTF